MFVEIPEVRASQHVLAIADIDRPVVTKSRLNDRFERSYIYNGTSILTPAYTSY
jgi:hypothetical protein